MSSQIEVFLTESKRIIIFVVLHLLFIFTVVDTQGFSFKYLDNDNKVLSLKCDGSVFVTHEVVVFITIYNVTSMRTIAQMNVGDCPTVGDGGVANNIYTLACVPHNRDPLPILKVIIADLEQTSTHTFGCNVTKLGESGDAFQTTWTIVLDKTGPSHVGSERAAESRSQPTDKSAEFVDSYLPMYAMGFAILSLALGLLTALCYIGMNMLKSRRSSANDSEGGRSNRPNDTPDDYNEGVSESDNRPDVGCERSLICPTAACRRPSYQGYSEPLSPTPSDLSGYVGIDFMQLQLSDKLVTEPFLRLPKSNIAKKRPECENPLYDKVAETYAAEVPEATVCAEVADGHSNCFVDSTVIVLDLEHAMPERQEWPGNNVISGFDSHAGVHEKLNRKMCPQRVFGLIGHF